MALTFFIKFFAKLLFVTGFCLSLRCVFSLDCIMMLYRCPLVWLLRLRHRRGYGIHSPFAFDFVTGVVYEDGAYYAYEVIERGLRWWQRGRYRGVLRLLLRLCNFWHGRRMVVVGGDVRMWELCRRYHVVGESVLLEMGVGTDVVSERCGVGEVMIVVVGIDVGEGRRLWRGLLDCVGVVASFDMYDVGVAFVGVGATRGRYVVNW